MVLAAVLAAGAPGCGSGGDDLRDRARAALDRAIAALVVRDDVETGVLHAGEVLARLSGDRRVLAWVARHKDAWREDLFFPILDPSAPRVPMEGEPPVGLARLTWVLASAVQGKEFPSPELATFLATEARGYLLAHQVWALVWAEAAGRTLDGALRGILESKLRALRAEVMAWPRFSDLFAESLHLLLTRGDAEGVPPAWVETLLAHQGENGLFVDGTRWRIAYDGESRDDRATATHTTVHAAAALAAFLAQRR